MFGIWWVGQGCPHSVRQDSTYRVSSQALQSGALIRITKRRGVGALSSPAKADTISPGTSRVRAARKSGKFPHMQELHGCRTHRGRLEKQPQPMGLTKSAHLQNLTGSVSAPKLPSPPKPSGDDLKPFLGH